jgi:hypothetical protein
MTQSSANDRHVVSLVALAIVASVGVWGCQAVLGIGADAKLAPDSGATVTDASTDGTSADVASDVVDAPSGPCAVPTTGGDAAVRGAALVPSLDAYEICLTPQAGGATIPLFGSFTGACPKGLLYKDVTAPLPIASGAYAAKLVLASKGCGDAGLATLASVTFDSASTTTIAALGDGNTKFQLGAFHESIPSSSNPSKFRVINASSDGPSIDFGLVKQQALPTSLIQTFFSNVAFGTTSPAGSGAGGAIDANGYVEAAVSGATLLLGAAQTGTSAALISDGVKMFGKHGYSVYAIGTQKDNRFPYELMACDETKTDGVYALCANATPSLLQIDVFNTQLSGDFGPLETLRAPKVPDAIAALTSDVACITDVVFDSDKKAIIESAKAHFPYSYWVPTTGSTPVNDPTDLSGAMRTESTMSACPDMASASALNDLVSCVTSNCQDPSDGALVWAGTNCLSTNCIGQVSALAFGGSTAPCWDCALVDFFGRTPNANIKSDCTTGGARHYAAGGSNSVVILSRFPIGTGEIYVMPSTDFRIAVLRAPITTDTGAKLDVYCADLTTPASGPTRPYTGIWGADATGAAAPDSATAWSNELLLQVKKAAQWAKDRTAATGGKGVLAGDFYAGPDLPPVLTGVHVDSFNALTSVWPLAQAIGYSPKCTFCSANPITTPPTSDAGGTTSGGSDTWTSYATLVNMAITEVVSNQVILDTPAIDYMDPTSMTTYKVPYSNYYGMRTTLRVRP